MRDIRTDKLIAIAVTSMLAAGSAAVAATGISANASEHGQGIEAVSASAPTSFTIGDGESRADSYLISSLILARDEDGHDVIEEISPSDAISADGESGGMVIQVPDNGEYDLDPADNAISFPKLMVSYASRDVDVKLDELGNGQYGYKVTASLDGVTQFYVIRFETDLGDGGGSDEPAADGVLSHLTINDRVFTASEINQAKTEEGLTLDEKMPFDENNQLLISAGFTDAEPDQYRLDPVTSGNVLTIDVIDDGGIVVETLTITFLQGGDDTPSQGDQTDATLASIDIMGHMVDVDAAASPDGATLVLSHEEFMEFDVEKDVTATPTQSGKGTSISGHYDGVTGVLTITVTAPDQVTKKQYKVTLVDEEASDESLQLKSVSWGTDSTNRVSLSAAEVMNGSMTVEYPSGVEPSNSDVICELVDDDSEYSVEYDDGNSRFDITVTNSSGESITYRLPVRTSDLSDEDMANSTVSRIVITGRDGVEHVIEGSNLDAAASSGGYTLLLDKDAIGETTDLEIRVTPSVVGQPNIDTKLDGDVLTLTQRSIDGQHTTVYTINLDYGDTGDDDKPVQQEVSFKIELSDGTVGNVTCTEGMTYREALTGADVDFDEDAEYVDAEGNPVDLDSEAKDGVTLKVADVEETVTAKIEGTEHEFPAGTTYAEALDELGYDYTGKTEEGYTFDLFDKTSGAVVKPTDMVTDGADVTVSIIDPDAPAVEVSVSTYDTLTDRLIGTGAASFEADDSTATVGTLMNRLKKIFITPDHSASKYEFVEWRYEDGTPVDEGASVFDIIGEDGSVSFYAHYEKTETGGEEPGDDDEQVTVTINDEEHTFDAGTTYAEALDKLGYNYTANIEAGNTVTITDRTTGTVLSGNDVVTDGADIHVGITTPPIMIDNVSVSIVDTLTDDSIAVGDITYDPHNNPLTIGDLMREMEKKLKAPDHTDEGYKFTGWYYKDGNKVDESDLISEKNEYVDGKCSMVFYAHYEKIDDSGDGGSGDENTNTPSGSDEGQNDGTQGNESQPGTDNGESGGNAGSDNENGAGSDTQDGTGEGTVTPDGEYGDGGQLAQSGEGDDGTGGVAGEASETGGAQLTQTGAETVLPVAFSAIVSAFAAAAAFARRQLTGRR